MNKTKARLLAAIILLMALTLMWSSSFCYYNEPKAMTSEQWKAYKLVYGLDPLLPASTFKGLFNTSLWEEKGVIAYGDYSSILPNDFKAVKGGYYLNASLEGEYRYHGYSKDGMKVTNSDFPRDASSGTPLAEKNWYYRPWEKSSPVNNLYLKHVGTTMTSLTKAALGLDSSRSAQEVAIIRKWMSDGLGFQIEHGTKTGFDSMSDKDVYNYLSVVSPPTSLSSGTGIMMHKSKYGGNWYQVMSISKINDKLMPALKLGIDSVKVTGYSSNGNVSIEVSVYGSLNDDKYFSSDVLRSVYFTRFDIEKWDYSISGLLFAAKGADEITKHFSSSGAVFRLEIPREKYVSLLNEKSEFPLELKLIAKAAMYAKGKIATGSYSDTYMIKGVQLIEPSLHTSPESPEFTINPAKEMLDIESFRLSLEMKEKLENINTSVQLDSVLLSDDEKSRFLEGGFIFPNHKETQIHSYKITFTSSSGAVSSYSSKVIVYDSDPVLSIHAVSGDMKEGRLIEIGADLSATPEYVLSRTQNKIDSIKVFGQEIKSETSADSIRLWARQPGDIRISAHAYNQYGESTSEKVFNISEDMPPDIQVQISGNAIFRGESIRLLSQISSPDSDEIDAGQIRLLMDKDGDGTYETKLSEQEDVKELVFTPERLGSYCAEISAKEKPVVNALDGYPKTAKKRLYFEVINAAPVTKIASSANAKLKKTDLTLLVDKSLSQSEKDKISASISANTQKLLANGIDSRINIWNVGTFYLSKSVQQRIHTSATYPSSSISYTLDGYSGTLTRTKVEDYPYVKDMGSYITVTESKTFTKYSQTNVVTGKGRTNPYVTDSVTYSNPAPATFAVSEDGYKGELPRTGTIKVIEASYVYSPVYYDSVTKTNRQTWTSTQGFQAVYSGTLTKTYTIWKPNLVTYHDYYGVYNGSVSKPYQESYLPNYRPDSEKIAVYITGDSVSGKSQLDSLKSKVDGLRLISIATKSGEALLPGMERIAYSGDIASSMDKLLKLMSSSYPPKEILMALIGENVKIEAFDTDLENDQVDIPLHQIVHDPNYFESSLGLEDGTTLSYSEESYLKMPLKTVFNKPGKYVIYRKIRDLPDGNETFSKYSNPDSLEVIVHRKPVSDFTVVETYNPATGRFNIVINDSSYDPDHRSSNDKGIVKASFRYRLPSGEWIYNKPSSLTSGTYTFAQTVLDNEGSWSDEVQKTITIKPNTGVKISKALFAPKNLAFSLSSIAATEEIKSLSIETKYPYPHSIEANIVNASGNEVLKMARYDYDSSKDKKTGDVISWRSISLIVPESLRNGDYKIRVKAFDLSVPTIYDVVETPITVFTPANIRTSFDSLLKGSTAKLNSTTSKYVKSLSAILFDGTSLQKKVDFAKDPSSGAWIAKYIESRDIQEGNYFITFTATMPSGQIEIYKRDFKYEAFTVGNYLVKGEWNHWRGQRDKITGEILEINPIRFLGLESIGIEVEIEGNPETVQLIYPHKWNDVNANGYNYTLRTGLEALPHELVETDGKYRLQFILPAVEQTLGYMNERLEKPYEIEVLIKDGVVEKRFKIEGIEVTGSIYDLIYFLPKE